MLIPVTPEQYGVAVRNAGRTVIIQGEPCTIQPADDKPPVYKISFDSEMPALADGLPQTSPVDAECQAMVDELLRDTRDQPLLTEFCPPVASQE